MDILKGGNIGVWGSWGWVYYLLENVIHYYYCQSEGGKTAVKGGRFPPFPSPRKYLAVIVSSKI